MRVAIIGATGLVGQQMLSLLASSAIPVDRLIPVASSASIGKMVTFREQSVEVLAIDTALALQPNLVLMSAGSDVAKNWGPKFAAQGSYVIDNSSAFRMQEDIPLIVPEVNSSRLDGTQHLIANPNCSTIQLVMVLSIIEQLFPIDRVIISTYQSVTGTGYRAIKQLHEERAGRSATQPAYPYPIDLNCIPQCDVFVGDGYTKEEMKLVHESRKILNLPDLRISATAVRIPTVGGHSESVNITCHKTPDINQIRAALQAAKGIMVMDDPAALKYPMPALAKNKDEVFVGRIRKDLSDNNSLNLWIVADNLRKGAATNSVQIATYLYQNGWL